MGPCFPVFLAIHGPSTFGTLPHRLYYHYYHAMPQASTCGQVLALARLQVLQNSGLSDVHVKS